MQVQPVAAVAGSSTGGGWGNKHQLGCSGGWRARVLKVTGGPQVDLSGGILLAGPAASRPLRQVRPHWPSDPETLPSSWVFPGTEIQWPLQAGWSLLGLRPGDVSSGRVFARSETRRLLRREGLHWTWDPNSSFPSHLNERRNHFTRVIVGVLSTLFSSSVL